MSKRGDISVILLSNIHLKLFEKDRITKKLSFAPPMTLHYTDREMGHVTQMWDTHFLIEGVRLEDEFAS